jgi:acyl dehydratase
MSKTLIGSHQDLVELASSIPETGLAVSSSVLVDSARIIAFADATGDHQWIHVDFERARTGPFGKTIAHGYLTLSLAPALLFELIEPGNEGIVIMNYGLNKVRFPSPVPSGSEVSMKLIKVDVTSLDEQSSEGVFTLVLYVDGDAKPACVMEAVYRFYW